jgi:hypothetical protein
LYEQTGDIAKVQKALGHAEIANTMRYTRVGPEGIMKGIEALPFWDGSNESTGQDRPPAAVEQHES